MSKRTKSSKDLVKVLESKLNKLSSDDSDSSEDSDTSESLSLSSSDEKSKSKSSSRKSKQSKKKKKKKSSSKKKKKKYSSDSGSDNDLKSKKSKKKKKKYSKDKDKDDKEALHRKLKLLNAKPIVGDVSSAKRKSSIEDGATASKKAKLDKSSDKSKNIEQLDINEAILGAIEKEMTTNASQTISEILDDILGSERVKINEKKLLEDSLKNITIKKEKEDDLSAIKIKKEKVDKINNSQKKPTSSSNKIKILPVKLNRSRREPEESDQTKKSNGKENKRTITETGKSECRDGDKKDDQMEEKETEEDEEDVPLPPVADVFVEDLLASQAAAELVKTNSEKPQKPGKITIGNLKQPTVFKQVEDAEKKRRSKYEDGEITSSEHEEDDENKDEADNKTERTKKDKKKKRSTKHRKYRTRDRSRTRSPDRSSKGSSHHHSSASSRSRHNRQRGSRSRSRSGDRTPRDRRRERESERDRARDRRRDEKDRRSRRHRAKRSRSISLSLSPEQRRKSKSPIDASSKIDKKKLLEIARRNAASMMAEGGVLSKKFDWRMAGKSVNELTDFCKSLSRKGEEGEESSESESSAESVEAPFHHPFEIKTRPDTIVMNIKNAQALKTKSFQEKTVEQSKQLSLQFPVSSGSQHRRTESEWVPVPAPAPPGAPQPEATLNFSAVAIPGAPPLETAMAARAIAPVPAPAPVPPVAAPLAITPAPPPPQQQPAPPPVFSEPDPDVQNMDIGSVVSQRLRAMRRLAENPHDSEAQMQMYHAQKKMQAWAESKQMPGQFTGSTEVRILTPQELASGSQAWVRKEQFETAAPVRGGMGMHLLQKMGWQPGQGLGKNMEGSLEPLQMDIKLDKRGLVAKEELPQQRKNPFVYRRGGMGGPPMSMGRGGPPPGPRPPMQMSLDGKHPVSLLHEFCMRRKLGVPQYEQVAEDGPPHKKTFIFKEILPLILATRQPRKSSCIAQNLLAQSSGQPLPHALDQMENETVANHAPNQDNYETFQNCDNTFDHANNCDHSTENYLPSSSNPQDDSNDIFREFSRGPRENDRYHFYRNNSNQPQPGGDPPNHAPPNFAGSDPQPFPCHSSFQSFPNRFDNKTNTPFNSSSPFHSSNIDKTNASLNFSHKKNVPHPLSVKKNSSAKEGMLSVSTMSLGDFPHTPSGMLPNQPEEEDVTDSTTEKKAPPRSSRRLHVKKLYYTRNRTGLDNLLKTIMSQSSLSEDDLLAISEIYEARKCIALGKKLFKDMKTVTKEEVMSKVQENHQEAPVGESHPQGPPCVNAANLARDKKTDIENRRNSGSNFQNGVETRFETHGNQREDLRNDRAWNRDDRNTDELFRNHTSDGINNPDRSRLNSRNKALLSPPRKSRKKPPPLQNNSENRLNRSPSPRLKNRSPSPQNIGQGPNTSAPYDIGLEHNRLPSPPYDNEQRPDVSHLQYNSRYEPNRPMSPKHDNRYGHNQPMSPTHDNRHSLSQPIYPTHDNRFRPNQPIYPTYNNRHRPNQPISPTYDNRHRPNQSISPTYDSRHRPNQSISPTYDSRHGLQLPISPTYDSRHGFNQSASPPYLGQSPDTLPPMLYDNGPNRSDYHNTSPSPHDIRHGQNRSHSPRYDIRNDRLPFAHDIRHRTSQSPPQRPGQVHETRAHNGQAHQPPPRSPSRLHNRESGAVDPSELRREENRAPPLGDKSLQTSAAAAAQVNLENCAPSSLESGEIESGELTEDDEDKFSISEAAHSPKKEPINRHHTRKERLENHPKDSGRTREKDVSSRNKNSKSKGSTRCNVVGEYKPPDVDRWLQTNFNAASTPVESQDKTKAQILDKDSKTQNLSGKKSLPVKVWKDNECPDGQRKESVSQSKQDPSSKPNEVEKICVNSLKKVTVETKFGAKFSEGKDAPVSNATQDNADNPTVMGDVSMVPSKESCEQSNNKIASPEMDSSKTEKPATSDTSQEPVSGNKASEWQQDASKSLQTTAVDASSSDTSSPNKAKKSSIFNRLDPPASESNEKPAQPVATTAAEASRYGNYHSEGEISLSDEDSIYSTSHLIPNLEEMMLQEITPLMELKVPHPENAVFSPGRYADPEPTRYHDVSPGYSGRVSRPLSPGRYSPPRRRSNVSPGRDRTHSLSSGHGHRTQRGSPAHRMSFASRSPSPSPDRVVRRAPTPEEVDLRTLLQTLQAPVLPRQDDLEPVLCEVYEAPREDNQDYRTHPEDYARELSPDFARAPLGYPEDDERDSPEHYDSKRRRNSFDHEQRYEHDVHSPGHSREYRRYSASGPDNHRSDDYRRYNDRHSSDRYSGDHHFSDHHSSDHQSDHSRPTRRHSDSHHQDIMSEGRPGGAAHRPSEDCETTERELFNPDELFDNNSSDLYNPASNPRDNNHYREQRGHSHNSGYRGRGGFRGQRGSGRRGQVGLRRGSRPRRSNHLKNPY